MKRFFIHMLVCIRLYVLGYYFSKNDHSHGTWGFYRFNFEKEDSKECAIFDIDFTKGIYTHVHRGYDRLHRWD